MQAELIDLLGYKKNDRAGKNSGDSRNGAATKTLKAILERARWRRREIATAATSRRHGLV